MKRVQLYICVEGKKKKRMNCCSGFLRLLMLPCCSERPQNTGYSPRRKGKQSTNTTLHLFLVIIQVSFLFFGGGGGGGRGSVLLGRNFGVLSQTMKKGNFASATSIAAGVWFSYSKQRHCKNVLGITYIKPV